MAEGHWVTRNGHPVFIAEQGGRTVVAQPNPNAGQERSLIVSAGSAREARENFHRHIGGAKVIRVRKVRGERKFQVIYQTA